MSIRRPLPELADIPGELERIRAELSKLQHAGGMAPLTEYGYDRNFKEFSAWCLRLQLCSLPASSDTLSLFIADKLSKGKKVSTLRRLACGVAFIHRRHGFESPMTQSVKDTLSSARRQKNESPRQMHPVTVEQLREIAAVLAREGSPIAVRNRAIVLLGFASALRRTNLASMQLEDISFCDQGIEICVRKEKQNQAGPARFIAVPFGRDEVSCPVRSLTAWLEYRGRENGPLFIRLDAARFDLVPPSVNAKLRGDTTDGATKGLSWNAIGKIVKAAIGKVVEDTTQYGPHSLRAGLISEAGQAGVNHLVIAATSGHRSLSSLRTYFRPRDRFKTNAAAATGL